MIFDTLDRLPFYLPADVWEKVKPVMENVTLPVGEVVLDGSVAGSEIFAAVSEYETKPEADCRFETHVKYADIQIVLGGSEEIGVAPAESLVAATEYDAVRDVRFYQPAIPPVRLTMQSGTFAVFFPQDAHLPQMAPQGKAAAVKKMVIKIRMERFAPGP